MARYSRIRVGTWQDNASILKFLKSIPTTTSEIVFRFERKPDYFRYLRYQSRKPFVFTFHNDDGSLGGVASLCLKNLFFKGQMASMIYMSDVRMSPSLSRRTRIDWRSWYSDIVRHAHEIEEFNYPQFLFTLVMDGNEAPLRAFARGKSGFLAKNSAGAMTCYNLATCSDPKQMVSGWDTSLAGVTVGMKCVNVPPPVFANTLCGTTSFAKGFDAEGKAVCY